MYIGPVRGRGSSTSWGVLVGVASSVVLGVFVFALAFGLAGTAVGIGVAGSGAIHGTVLTADGEPAAGDGVVVFVEEGENVGESEMVITDEDGSFSVEPPEGETLDVGFYRNYPAGDPIFPSDGVPDVYALAQVDGPADLGTTELPEGHPVEIVVIDEDGNPIEGATVSVEHRNSGAVAAVAGIATDADGRLDLPDGSSLDLAGDIAIQAQRPLADDEFVGEPQRESLTVTGERTVEIVIPSPTPPEAVARAPETVESGDEVILDASDSTDPDGSWPTFEWKQVKGPEVTIDPVTSSTTGFTAPDVDDPVELTFEVVVTDRYGLTDQAIVTTVVEPKGDGGPGAPSEDTPLRLEATLDDERVLVTALGGEAGESASVGLPRMDWPVAPTEVGLTLDNDVSIGTVAVIAAELPPDETENLNGTMGYVTVEGVDLDESAVDSLLLYIPVEGADGEPIAHELEGDEWTAAETTTSDGAVVVTLDEPTTIALVDEPETTSIQESIVTPTSGTPTHPVTPESGSPPEQTSTTPPLSDADVPGFGIIVGILGVLLAAFASRRK